MNSRLPVAITLVLASCSPDSTCDEEPVPPMDAAADAVEDITETTSDANGDVLVDTEPDAPPPDPIADETLAAYCETHVGEPRIAELADGLWLAIGHDLANTMILETSEGLVVVDVGMSPTRASEVRRVVDETIGGEIAAIIYTHSHIDHVGGATEWADDDTEIWATEAFTEHFVKQYAAFAIAETRRGNRQFGLHVDDEALPCSALGRRADVDAALETGALLPNQTFSGSTTLEFGDVRIELYEAHGETHDQLYVWIPHLEALLPGDNYYAAFPNLYTIRGTSPRPVDEWIASLDRMRAHDPALLVPSHTIPVVGRDAVREALTSYRDGIQWIRDGVARGANAGLSVDQIVEEVTLPDRLAGVPALSELYGRVDWSVRAIYGNNLGWFDERTTALYPPEDAERREIELMGGADAVLAEADRALASHEPRWALHLLDLLERSGSLPAEALAPSLGVAYAAIAAAEPNTNGRGWLLESALELTEDFGPTGQVQMNPRLVAELPMDVVFDVLPSRLDVEAAADVHMAVRLDLDGRAFVVTVRQGIAEVVEGDALPGTPAISATITTDELTWKEVALGLIDPTEAVLSGDIEIDDLAVAIQFLGFFVR